MRRALLIGTAVVVACSEPTIPERAAWYGFDNAGDVFHWPRNRLPVRYYADTRGSMSDIVTHGLGSWESQLLYGEFTAEMVADSNVADVIVTWFDSVPPYAPPDPGAPVFACDGVTTFLFDAAGTSLTDPIRTQIRITTAQSYTLEQVAACVRRVVVHELGHTIGLLQESPAPEDVMYSTVAVAAPSGRDRQTLQVLYHTTPTIAPAPR
ncbi:MAG TPA: matrixin family metalloprotease [Gemmatimonadales bacterium]|nr:matrixin family metalloprotease [Gemmatimonadales bacterium]